MHRELSDWSRFVRSQAHILNRDPSLVVQQAANRPSREPTATAAARHLERGRSRPWIRWINKPSIGDRCLLTLNVAPARDCRFSPRGSQLLTWTSSDAPEAALWDMRTGQQISRWPGAVPGFPAFVTMPDTRGAIVLRDDASVALWHADSGAEIDRFAIDAHGARTCSVDATRARVVVGYENGTIRSFDRSGPVDSFTVPSHAGPVLMSAFLRNGRRLVTRDATVVRILDADSGERLCEVPNRHGYTYKAFAISPDETWLMLEERNETAGKGWTSLWCVDSGRAGLPVTGREHAITPVAVGPGGDRVLGLEFVRGDISRTAIDIWSVSSNYREARYLLGWLSPWPPVDYSPDGRWIATGRSQPVEPGDIELWDLSRGEGPRAAHLQGHGDHVSTLSFSPDSRLLASIDGSGTLRVWSVEASSAEAVSPGHADAITICEFTPDGRLLLTASSQVSGFQHGQADWTSAKVISLHDAEFRTWRTETGTLQHRLPAGQKPASVAFSPTNAELVVGFNRFGRNSIRIGRIDPLAFDRERPTPSAWMVGYSPDGERVISAAGSLFRLEPEHNALTIWAADSGDRVATLLGHEGELDVVDISADGRYAMSGSSRAAAAIEVPGGVTAADGDLLSALTGPKVPVDLFLWDLDRRARVANLPGHFGGSFSPDGRLVVARAADGTPVLWDYAVAASPTRLEVTDARGSTACWFTPEGRHLILAGGRDRGVRLVDPVSGRVVTRFEGPLDQPSIGQLTPDGNHLVAIDGSVLRVWCTRTGARRAAFPVSASLRTFAVCPDGRHLAVGDRLGGVGVLRLEGLGAGPGLVIATRRWCFRRFGGWAWRVGFRSGRLDPHVTVRCWACAQTMAAPPRILETIHQIARSAGLRDHASPCRDLPRDAWDDPGLQAACTRCGAAARFAPFVAGSLLIPAH